MQPRRESSAGASRRLVLVAAAAIASALSAGAAYAQITEMDYMTEGTADAAVRKALETCTASTGVTVDRQPVPYPELVQKVLLAASSNSLPDIIYIDNSDVAQLADGGYIAPLADVGIKTEGFVPALAALGNYKGTDYAVPSANNTIALYYNTDMFTAAGLEPPKTWDELRETAKKLTKDQTYGLVFPGINNEQGAFHTSTFVWSNGGTFEKLNSPEVVGALTYMKSLVDDGSVSKSVVTWAIDDARDQFVAGRAAMMIGGSWLLPQLDAHPDLKYGVVPIPTPKAGEQVKVPVGGELWVVSVTADKEAAKKVLGLPVEPGRPARIRQGPQQHPGGLGGDRRVQRGAAAHGAVRRLDGRRAEPHRRPRHRLSEILRRLFGGDAGCSHRRQDPAGGAR